MEIKVGIQHVNREVVVETSQTAEEIERAFSDALADDVGVSTLIDEHGRKVLIPAAKIAYVDLGEENARQVGFGCV